MHKIRAQKSWRVSPLMKVRLFFGMPWVLALGVLFVLGLGVGIIRWANNGELGSGMIIPAVIFGCMIAVLVVVGIARAQRQVGILEYAMLAEGRIENVVEREFRSNVNQPGSKFYTFELALSDDDGNEWKATYAAGVMGFDAREGERLEVLVDTRNPMRVQPLKYLPHPPNLGEDGVIHPHKPGEVYGYLGVAGFIAVVWVVALLL